MYYKLATVILAVLLIASLVWGISGSVSGGQMKKTVDSLTEQLQASEKNNTNLADQVSSLTGQLSTVEEEKAAMALEAEAQANSMQSLSDSVRALYQHLLSLQRSSDENEADGEGSETAESTAAEDLLAQADTLLTSLNEAYRTSVSTLTEESQEKTKVIDRLTADLAVADVLADAQTADIAELQKNLETAEREKEQMRMDIARLTQEKEEMLGQLMVLQTTVSEWLNPTETNE